MRSPTERERIMALALIVSQGPVDEQIEAMQLTPEMVSYGNKILKVFALKIRDGMHLTLPDDMVRRIIREEKRRAPSKN